MKINWGTGIVIAFVVFIGFILFLIMLMMSDNKLDHELVTEDYYEKGTFYQKEIDAEKNSQLLAENIVITK
ncbi:MAG: FixH family protein, partial [Bacteroidetes bacterium]|nr:FixH family protein [Bacteroidota bacterium]